MNGELLFIIIILDVGIPRNVKSSSLHKKSTNVDNDVGAMRFIS